MSDGPPAGQLLTNLTGLLGQEGVWAKAVAPQSRARLAIQQAGRMNLGMVVSVCWPISPIERQWL